jgi:RNA polymerase sigma factor for flagellar operon FliA
MPRLSDPLPFVAALRARTGCERSARLRAHVPLLRQVAGRLRQRLPPGADLDELMQAGLIGLDEALSRFDASKGASFDHYAARRIEGAMLDALRASDELSRDTRARQRQIRDAVQALEHRLLRAPRAQEVAQALGWPLAKFHRCVVDAAASPLRLDDLSVPPHSDSDGGLPAGESFDGVADAGSGPEQALQRLQREAALQAAFNALRGRERLMMDLIYVHGLDHGSAAAALGVSPGRVSQMHTAVIQALRLRLRHS